MTARKLGTELAVFPVGLGCMSMSHGYGYGGQDESEAIRTLHRAVELGVNFFDTAEVYGPFNNEILVGKGLRPLRDKVNIATKFGFNVVETPEGPKQMPGLNSKPGHARAVAEGSLKRLGIEVHAGNVSEAQLRHADEIFITSTAGGIMPVTRLNDVAVGDGMPGELTRTIFRTYWDWHDDPAWTLAVDYDGADRVR